MRREIPEADADKANNADPHPQIQVPANPPPHAAMPDLQIPGGLLAWILPFIGGVLFPRLWAGVETRRNADIAYRGRELDRQQESDRQEFELLRTMAENNNATTGQLIATTKTMAESNQAMAVELRGLKDAIAETNQVMKFEVSDLRQRVEVIEGARKADGLAGKP
jgi:hypothetical protein